ncbi:MAG: FAD-binding protein [Thermoprotei archaeon]
MEPASVVEVVEILSEVRRANDRVLVRGYGKHSPDIRGVKRLYMRKLDWYEVRGDEVVAQAGAPVAKVQEEALSRGYLLPTTYDGSMGALFATNMPSPFATGYGNPSDWVETLKVALPGKIVSWRGFAGTFGKVGAIVEVRVKLFPRPRKVYTVETASYDMDMGLVESLIARRPLASLIMYDGKWRAFFTFHSDLEVPGFAKEEGAVGLSFSPNKRTYWAMVGSVREFVEAVRASSPKLALYVHGAKYAVFENPAKVDGLRKFGEGDRRTELLKKLFVASEAFY